MRGPFSDMYAAFREGRISRRDFLERSTALGMAGSVALWLADAGAQTPGASPAASPSASGVGVIPDAGTDNQTRGQGDEVKILQWQAPSQVNGLVATGDKDNLAASIVSESLLVRLEDGSLAPQLVKEVPTVENGLLAEDLTSVTYNLLDGVTWSDGEPFTAEDVVFTWQWANDPENGVVLASLYEEIANVEAIDDLTVKMSFDKPNPQWSAAFSGMGSGIVVPKHVLDGASEDTLNAFRSKPIGTGPYKVDNFVANDRVTYVINENYRHPNKPYFAKVTLKGGGDANAAARATLQTGEYDFGWNLAIEPDVLRSMESPDNPGELWVFGGLTMERVNINFSDPNKEVNGQRSEMNTPHPILSDLNVRKAIIAAIDRESLSKRFYFGPPDEPPVSNVLSGIPSMESPNTELGFDPDHARQLLDDAGWVLDGDVRKKDGMELKLVHYTTVSPVRQKIQASIKANLADVGIQIDIQAVDSAIFFDNAVGNEQNNTHFYQDMNEFASSPGAPPPVNYMVRWYSGPNREEIAQKSNKWAGRNLARYTNPDYDALYEQARTEPDVEKVAQLMIQMNDILYNDAAVIPLVRYGSKAGVSKRLRRENIALNGYEFSYWNIANWNLAEGAS